MAENDLGSMGGTMEVSQSDFSTTGTGSSPDASGGPSANVDLSNLGLDPIGFTTNAGIGIGGAALGVIGFGTALALAPVATIAVAGGATAAADFGAGFALGAGVAGLTLADMNMAATVDAMGNGLSVQSGASTQDFAGAFISGAGSYTQAPADSSWSDPRNFASGTGSEGGGG